MPLPGALYTQKPIDPKTELFARAWLLYFNSLAAGSGVTAAPADAQYLVAATNGILTAERIATDTVTVAWDFTTPAQAKASIPDDAVTYAKMQDGSQTSMLLGVGTVLGTGELREITLGAGLSMSGDVLNRTDTATINMTTVALTDAQIKALPTTEQVLVADPGANLALVPMFAVFYAKTSSGAYTNINAAAILRTYLGSGGGGCEGLGYIVNDAAITNGSKTLVTDLLGTATNSRAYLIPEETTEGANGWGPVPIVQATSLSTHKPLSFAMNNGASGNLTGGNAANSLTIYVWTATVTVP
jgi:hypothetical protein